jgi:heme/copper-type cytochrome/quinol oxidase subunit 2
MIRVLEGLGWVATGWSDVVSELLLGFIGGVIIWLVALGLVYVAWRFRRRDPRAG